MPAYHVARSKVIEATMVPELLSTLLSIRNSDPQRAITVTSLRYDGTKGDLVQDYVEGSVRLNPLETAEFLVEKPDALGGSGAGFILAWRADEPVYEPIVEAVMVGGSAGNIPFTSLGRPLAERVG